MAFRPTSSHWHNSDMIDLANKFSRGSNENLLQLWQGRDQLNDDDINPLRDCEKLKEQ
jgi:hypothetical protein